MLCSFTHLFLIFLLYYFCSIFHYITFQLLTVHVSPYQCYFPHPLAFRAFYITVCILFSFSFQFDSSSLYSFSLFWFSYLYSRYFYVFLYASLILISLLRSSILPFVLYLLLFHCYSEGSVLSILDLYVHSLHVCSVFVTLKVEAASSSKTSVNFYQTAQCFIPATVIFIHEYGCQTW